MNFLVVVVMKPGEKMTLEELLDSYEDKKADFQMPRFIDFVKPSKNYVLLRFRGDF